MESVASAMGASWPLRQHTRRVPTTSSRSMLVRSDYAFPKGETGAGFGSPLLWEFDHHGASTSPGRNVVVLSAASPRGQRSGACRLHLPGRRRPLHNPSSDSAEALPIVVAHPPAPSFAAHRVQPPRPAVALPRAPLSRRPRCVRPHEHRREGVANAQQPVGNSRQSVVLNLFRGDDEYRSGNAGDCLRRG